MENISKGRFIVLGASLSSAQNRFRGASRPEITNFRLLNLSMVNIHSVWKIISFRWLGLRHGGGEGAMSARSFFSFSSRLLFYLFDLLFPLREREIGGSISYAVARSRRSCWRRRAFDRLRDGWRSDREPNFGNCFQELGQG